MADKFKTILGTNHKKPRTRIWLEGQRLKDAGFTVGTRYDRTLHGGGIVIDIAAEGKFKVSGKGDKPIIDITGSAVTERNFKSTHVFVEFMPKRICIYDANET